MSDCAISDSSARYASMGLCLPVVAAGIFYLVFSGDDKDSYSTAAAVTSGVFAIAAGVYFLVALIRSLTGKTRVEKVVWPSVLVLAAFSIIVGMMAGAFEGCPPTAFCGL